MKVAIHDGRFHTDEVFAIAALKMLGRIEYVRTRDPLVMQQCDLRVDVGLKNNPTNGDYDHHQPQGAGKRANGIPYASFGLVWKQFGAKITGSSELADIVDQKLVQLIDGPDNGIDLFKPIVDGASLFDIGKIVDTIFMPSWQDPSSPDDVNNAFAQAVDFASTVLSSVIKKSRAQLDAVETVKNAIDAADDKRLLIFDKYTPWKDIVPVQSPDALFVIQPAWPTDNGNWVLQAVAVDPNTFNYRKYLPDAWAGKRDGELAEITGVKGAVFCHRSKFMAVADSKQGCLDLAKLALGK